ncbi:phage baseplate assembly protein V [Dyella sp. 2RAB6]|uniref:phage baseplate assembly protein V n=1 Tax=Dyella sp. 2RAB6 TaxID=3232992 RepID=UPI003F8E65F7
MDRTTELARLLENLLRYGVVASVDHATKRCRVKTGQLLTAPLKWITLRAGSARTLWAPSLGEQVLLLSPGGDPARGCVLPALFSDAAPAPDAGPEANITLYPDGAVISYDPASHALVANLPGGGTLHVTAPAGVTVVGSLSVSDNVSVGTGATGSFTTPTGLTVECRDGIVTNIF